MGGVVRMIPVRLHAHLVSTGFGPLFDGIGHLVVTPQDLLPVIALALLAGLGGKAYGRQVLFVLLPSELGIWSVSLRRSVRVSTRLRGKHRE